MMGFGNPLFDGDRREGRKALEPTRTAPYKQKLKFLGLWAGNAAAPDSNGMPRETRHDDAAPSRARIDAAYGSAADTKS